MLGVEGETVALSIYLEVSIISNRDHMSFAKQPLECHCCFSLQSRAREWCR